MPLDPRPSESTIDPDPALDPHRKSADCFIHQDKHKRQQKKHQTEQEEDI